MPDVKNVSVPNVLDQGRYFPLDDYLCLWRLVPRQVDKSLFFGSPELSGPVREPTKPNSPRWRFHEPAICNE